jgi:two-component system, OmpR family, KDP operon response regulator KdpE
MAVWGPAQTEDTQYIRVDVGQLRQRVEAHANDPRIILTERGVGYGIGFRTTSVWDAVAIN